MQGEEDEQSQSEKLYKQIKKKEDKSMTYKTETKKEDFLYYKEKQKDEVKELKLRKLKEDLLKREVRDRPEID